MARRDRLKPRSDAMLQIVRKQFRYQVIPADVSEPIRPGIATFREVPSRQEIARVVRPLIDDATMMRVPVTRAETGLAVDMFVDELAIIKDLPRNERATTIFREEYLLWHPFADPAKLRFIAGTAILFDEPVVLD
jgi:hypothetical protein